MRKLKKGKRRSIRKFCLSIKQGRVVNVNPFIDLGREGSDPVSIIVAVFDLQGFTKFFHSVSTNKTLVVTSFINGLLYWFHYRFKHNKWKPIFSKFTGDGVLMIWEPGRQQLSNENKLALMNMCYNMVSAPDSYVDEFLPEFRRKLGVRWKATYPKKLKVGLSAGDAVRYIKDNVRMDYISESINIASRLVKFTPLIPFLAHSDIVIGESPKKYNYIEKRIKLRGIGPICVYVDKIDFHNAGSPDKFKRVK